MKSTMTDLQLKAQTVIIKDPRTKEHGIEVLENNGVITLKGSVPSREVKETAESILRDLHEGVKVINDLEVKSDANILSKIIR